jgi:hypothetical protein
MSNFDQTAEIFQFFGDSSFADMECSDLSLLRLPRLPLLWNAVAHLSVSFHSRTSFCATSI